MKNQNLYFDFECDRVVTREGEVTRQYKYFHPAGDYSFEKFAEDNFYLIPDEALDYYIRTYGEPENPKKDRPNSLVAEGLVPDLW